MFGCLSCICQLDYKQLKRKGYTLIADNKIRNNNMNDSSMPWSNINHQFPKHRNVKERNELKSRSSF